MSQDFIIALSSAHQTVTEILNLRVQQGGIGKPSHTGVMAHDGTQIQEVSGGEGRWSLQCTSESSVPMGRGCSV